MTSRAISKVFHITCRYSPRPRLGVPLERAALEAEAQHARNGKRKNTNSSDQRRGAARRPGYSSERGTSRSES